MRHFHIIYTSRLEAAGERPYGNRPAGHFSCSCSEPIIALNHFHYEMQRCRPRHGVEDYTITGMEEWDVHGHVVCSGFDLPRCSNPDVRPHKRQPGTQTMEMQLS